MLNPGPSSSYYGGSKGNHNHSSSSPYYPRWIQKITRSHSYSRHGHGHSHPAQQQAHTHSLFLLGFGMLAMLALAVYQHDRMLQEALHLKETEVEHHLHHSRALEQRVNTLRSQTAHLEDLLEDVERQHRDDQHNLLLLHENNNNNQHDQQSNNNQVDLETQRKVFHLEHENLKMQQDVQAMSKRMVKEK